MESRTKRAKGVGASRGMILAALVAVFAVITDQLTKAWALSALVEGRRIGVIGEHLSLVLTRNSGVAFSLGASSTWIFTILALVIIGVLVYALVRARSTRLAASIGLLLGGAIGNLIDRLIQPPSFGQGHVIDFIDYAGFFVGNVADIWIVLGAAWLAIEMILGEKTKHE